MNLAAAAPEVEAAVADKAEYTDPAVADMVQQSAEVRVSPARVVDAAVSYDDPMRYAPDIVANPKELKPNALSVQVLRGQSGSDFESYAAVLRGAPDKNFLKRFLPFIFDERDFVAYGEVKKYALVKGDCCFIYGEETDPSPIYAIPLFDLYPIQEDPNKPDKGSITVSPLHTNKPRKEMVTILLKYKSNNNQAYQFTFDTKKDPSLAKRFLDVVQNCGVAAAKRGPVTASVVHAKDVSKEAMKTQPAI